MDIGSLLTMTERELLRSARVLLAEKYNKFFYAYLLLGASADFKNMYKAAFHMYIRDMSPRLQDKVIFAAMNLVFAMQAAIDSSGLGTQAELNTFVAAFIKAQMSDFYEWSADLI